LLAFLLQKPLRRRWGKKTHPARRVRHVRPSTTISVHREAWKSATLGAAKQGAKTGNRGNICGGKMRCMAYLLSMVAVRRYL